MIGYLNNFGLKTMPFGDWPDGRFAYVSKLLEVATDKIQYAVDQRQGLFVLTGEDGTGKTVLAQEMMCRWRADPSVVAAHVTDPAASLPAGFLRLILDAFGLPRRHLAEDSRAALMDFLLGHRRSGRNCVLVIDDAQDIKPHSRDAMHRLVNEEYEGAPLLQVVLLARPVLFRKLGYRPDLCRHIGGGATLDSLTLADALGLLRHRLCLAGGDFDVLVPAPLHRSLYNAARGNPRGLCRLCDHVLAHAAARRERAADAEALAAALACHHLGGRLFPVPSGRTSSYAAFPSLAAL